MLKDQRELLAALNAHGVEYLVIGGHAVSIHAEREAQKTWMFSSGPTRKTAKPFTLLLWNMALRLAE